ncbi:MAG: hypothetical protein KAX19_03555 [Candidatus Brocadiae bacterium]|nr:hypothetical protein [Candidatus Brocadiia bacterium]
MAEKRKCLLVVGFDGLEHTHSGVLAQGGRVFDAQRVKRATTYDVAPTILRHFGIGSGVALQSLGGEGASPRMLRVTPSGWRLKRSRGD